MLKKRITAFLAVFCMLLTLVPATALADANYAGLKTCIEGKVFAYAATVNATEETIKSELKTQFATQILDIENHEYPSTFVDKDSDSDVDAADVALVTTVTNNNNTLNVTTDGGTTALDCYKVSVVLADNTTAVGYIYKMNSAAQILIRGIKNGDPNYYLKDLEVNNVQNSTPYKDVTCTLDYGKYDSDNKDIDVGGARIISSSGSTDYCVSLQMGKLDGTQTIQYILYVYKPDFEGAMATCSGAALRADAWDFGNTPFMAFTNTTSSDPFVLETFFGYDSIAIGGLQGATINGISCDLPAGAVTINANTKTITFNSNYYDSVPLTIAYTENGQQKTGYVVIKRVGIDIQEYSNGQTETLHGTQQGIPIVWDGKDCVIYATYYWPAAKSQTDDIDLYCTKTYANGSVETELLTASTTTNADVNFTDKDDFLVYQGSKANKPVKVSIIAVKSGAFVGNDFGGATLGSGAGVTWTAK